MTEIKERDNFHYFEDALLTWKILDTIRISHNLSVEKVYRHVMINKLETDAVAVCTTPEGIERWVGFELKESDIGKAIIQAKLRRKYFDYFYIIINLRTKTIVDFILSEKDYLNKIGFVSAFDNVVVYSSRFQKREEIRVNEKVKRLEEVKELPLVKFLNEAVRND